MKLFRKKLQSNSGASLIIALIFMLVCVFVGGSVLVAATVNSNRIAGERTQQQAILDQRSLCAVFVKSLQNAGGDLDVSLPYTSSAQIKNPQNKYDSGVDALKYSVCKAAEQTCRENSGNKVTFAVEDPEGNSISCTAECMPNYTVYICFGDASQAQVKLKLSGRDTGSEITWYKAKIEKADTK